MTSRMQNPTMMAAALLLIAGCSSVELYLPSSPEADPIVQAPLAQPPEPEPVAHPPPQTPATTVEKVHAEAPQTIFLHVVLRGDTLESIALAYGAYVGDILRRNPSLAHQRPLVEDAILNVPYYGAHVDLPAESEPKPEAKPEHKPEIKPKPETKPEVKPKPEAKPEIKPEVKPKPEAKPEPQPEPKLEVKPAALVPEAKPEVKPEVKPEPKLEIKKPEAQDSPPVG